MQTFVQLHTRLEAAYTRAAAALDAFALQLEALPGAAAVAPSKPAKPKPAPRKPRKPAHQAEPSRNGQADRFPVADVPGAGF